MFLRLTGCVENLKETDIFDLWCEILEKTTNSRSKYKFKTYTNNNTGRGCDKESSVALRGGLKAITSKNKDNKKQKIG